MVFRSANERASSADELARAPNPRVATALRRLASVASIAVVAIGVAVLYGWARGIRWLQDPTGSVVAMSPNTALMLVLSGSALALAGGRGRACRALCIALALASFGIAGATAVEHATGRSLGIDAVLLAGVPSRPALSTAVALLLLSVALVAIDLRLRRWPTPSEWLATAAGMLASLTIGAYVFGAPQFFGAEGDPTEGAMAVHTAVGLLLLALAIPCARADTGMMAVVSSARVGGHVARRVLLGSLLIPVLGLGAALGARAGLYATEGAPVVVTVASVLVTVLSTLAVASSLNRTDAVRLERERELHQWKQCFDAAAFGVAFGSGGRLQRMNRAFAAMHGYEIEELAGTPIADLFPPERRDEAADRGTCADEQGYCRWESEHVRKDGSRFPVRVELAPVRAEDGSLLYRAAYVQDVTLEHQAEEVRARLAALVASASDAIVALSRNGTVLDWNRGAERVYGWSAAEMVGKSIVTIVPENRRAECDRLGTDALRGRAVVAFETCRVRKDGTRIPVALTVSSIVAGGRVVGLSTIERDISDQKRAERELREARERETAHLRWLEAVVEQTPEGVVIVGERGEVLLQNRAAVALASGRASPGVRAALLDELRAPNGEPVPDEKRPERRALERGESTVAAEMLVVAADGEKVPVLVSVAPIQLPRGCCGAVAVVRDIRELKALQREREEWSTVVAHDLRQPTTAIRMAASSLARGEGKEARAPVAIVLRAVDRLERMIEDLLDVSRLEARRLTVRCEVVDVGTLVRELLDLAPHLARRCRVDVADDARWARADAGRLLQILSNLLSNAEKYGAPGTPIDLVARREGEKVQVSVTNEGKGIAADEIPNLFSRFSRTRAARTGAVPGLGLGLYIARGLAEAQGGALTVESTPGRTTTFHLELALAPAPGAHPVA